MENQIETSKKNLSLVSSNREETSKYINFSLTATESRVGKEAKNKKLIIADVINEFPEMEIKDIQEAIRSGGLGNYGITYILTSQVVCFWIREYNKKKNKPKNLHLFQP